MRHKIIISEQNQGIPRITKQQKDEMGSKFDPKHYEVSEQNQGIPRITKQQKDEMGSKFDPKHYEVSELNINSASSKKEFKEQRRRPNPNPPQPDDQTNPTPQPTQTNPPNTDPVFDFDASGIWQQTTNTVAQIIGMGLGALAGTARYGIDTTASLLRELGHEVKKAGSTIYTDFRGGMADLIKAVNEKRARDRAAAGGSSATSAPSTGDSGKLPSWAPQCLIDRSSMMKANGDAVDYTHTDNTVYTLYQNGAVTSTVGNGSWRCDGSQFYIDTKKVIDAPQGAAGSTSDAGQFPFCVKNLVEQDGKRIGTAKDSATNTYTVHYTTEKKSDTTSDGDKIDGQRAIVYPTKGRKPANGVYQCGENGLPLIWVRDYGLFLTGDKNPKVNKTLVDVDLATIVKTYSQINDLFIFGEDGNVVGVDTDVLGQAVDTMQEKIKMGCRGRAIRRFYELLYWAKNFLQSQGNQFAEYLQKTMDEMMEIDAYLKNAMQKDWNLFTNPTNENMGDYTPIPVTEEPFVESMNIVLYQSQRSQMAASKLDDVTSEVDTEIEKEEVKDEKCIKVLESYLKAMGGKSSEYIRDWNKNYKRTGAGVTPSQQNRILMKKQIAECYNDQIYSDRKYRRAIDYIRSITDSTWKINTAEPQNQK